MRYVINVDHLPPAELSPNSRCNHFKRAEAAAVYRQAVFAHAVDLRNRYMCAKMWRPFERCRLRFTVVFATARQRDMDNLVARLKPARDALVSAGYFPNDDPPHLEELTPIIRVEPHLAPKTIIELEEI